MRCAYDDKTFWKDSPVVVVVFVLCFSLSLLNWEINRLPEILLLLQLSLKRHTERQIKYLFLIFWIEKDIHKERKKERKKEESESESESEFHIFFFLLYLFDTAPQIHWVIIEIVMDISKKIQILLW